MFITILYFPISGQARLQKFQLRGGGFLGTRIFPEKEQEMASEIFLQKSTVILDI